MAILLSAATLAAALSSGCAGEFGTVSRSTKVSDGSRITASNIVPRTPELRGVAEQLALAEEIYSKQLDNLRDRRDSLRTRRRGLTLASFATLATTTLVISAAAINSSSNTMTDEHGGLKMAGYGALGGLGLGTTLEVVNLMQEDPSAIDAKIRNLQASYDTMVDRLKDVFTAGANPGTDLRAMPIIEQFINEALQISVKG